MGEPSRLAEAQRRALARLKKVPGTRDLYLAGGAAVGWHLGHRISNDLDLFSITSKLPLGSLRRAVTSRVRGSEVLALTDATLRVRVEGIPIDIVRYPYPLLDAPRRGPEGFRVAGLRDLAAMKLATIAGRGLRRDFWDLYTILRNGMSLVEATSAFEQRFGQGEAELYHLARALTYFDDAEREEAFPAGLTAARWRSIKSFFVRQAPKLLRARGGPVKTARK
jgi:hypothetical protein